MEFSELALPAEGASSAGRALSPAPSALKPACELIKVLKIFEEISPAKMLYRQKIASVWIRNLSRGLNRVQETGSRNVKRVEVIDLVTSYHPQVHFKIVSCSGEYKENDKNSFFRALLAFQSLSEILVFWGPFVLLQTVEKNYF